MSLRTCYIVLKKQEGALLIGSLWVFERSISRKTLELSENLSSSFKKYVYYGTSFNMYQWHITFSSNAAKKGKEFDFWRSEIALFVGAHRVKR
jgi:hypothetical protein